MADCDGTPCVTFPDGDPDFDFEIDANDAVDPGTPDANADTPDSKAIRKVLELLFDAAVDDGDVQAPAGSSELIAKFKKLYVCDSPCKCVTAENASSVKFDVSCPPGDLVFSLDKRWSYRIRYTVTAHIWGSWGQCKSDGSGQGEFYKKAAS